MKKWRQNRVESVTPAHPADPWLTYPLSDLIEQADMHVTHSVQITGIAKIQLVKAEGQNSSICQCTTCTTWSSYYSPAAWVHCACYEFINLSTYVQLHYDSCLYVIFHMLSSATYAFMWGLTIYGIAKCHATLHSHTTVKLILYFIFDMIWCISWCSMLCIKRSTCFIFQ